MYDTKKVQWWLERSRSPEYQKAYDKIAEHLPRIEGGVFIEVACGSGEVLKRVHSKGYVISDRNRCF